MTRDIQVLRSLPRNSVKTLGVCATGLQDQLSSLQCLTLDRSVDGRLASISKDTTLNC